MPFVGPTLVNKSIFFFFFFISQRIQGLNVQYNKKNPIELGKRGASCIFGLSVYMYHINTLNNNIYL
jgi:hypothetical protein